MLENLLEEERKTLLVTLIEYVTTYRICSVLYDNTKTEKEEKHICYHYKCKMCKKMVPDNHNCFFQPSSYCKNEKKYTHNDEEELDQTEEEVYDEKQGDIEETGPNEKYIIPGEEKFWEGWIVAFDCETSTWNDSGEQMCHHIQWNTACFECSERGSTQATNTRND